MVKTSIYICNIYVHLSGIVELLLLFFVFLQDLLLTLPEVILGA